jgi:hypothetical protein
MLVLEAWLPEGTLMLVAAMLQGSGGPEPLQTDTVRHG